MWVVAGVTWIGKWLWPKRWNEQFPPASHQGAKNGNSDGWVAKLTWVVCDTTSQNVMETCNKSVWRRWCHEMDKAASRPSPAKLPSRWEYYLFGARSRWSFSSSPSDTKPSPPSRKVITGALPPSWNAGGTRFCPRRPGPRGTGLDLPRIAWWPWQRPTTTRKHPSCSAR